MGWSSLGFGGGIALRPLAVDGDDAARHDRLMVGFSFSHTEASGVRRSGRSCRLVDGVTLVVSRRLLLLIATGVIVGLFSGMAGCADSSLQSTGSVCDEPPCVDTGDDASDVPGDLPDDTALLEDAGEDDLSGDEGDLETLLPPGALCEDDHACESGFCLPAGCAGTLRCLAHCRRDDDCGSGDRCRTWTNAGGDAVTLCFPAERCGCDPCEDDADCGGAGGRCVALEDGRFCAAPCREGGCEDGFVCESVAGDVGVDDLCMPEGNVCTCVDGDGDAFGEGPACAGPDCNDADADVHPDASEVCDGVDNDCDTEVDEGVANACGGCEPLDGAPDAACGVCLTGTYTCLGPNALRCQGEDPAARRRFWPDTDGDGLGEPDDGVEPESTEACAAPLGYVANDDDACPGEDDRLDSDGDTVPDCLDDCPDGPDVDEDGDEVCDSADRCPGEDDRLDSDADDTPDCLDACPADDTKTEPGVCGCGVADDDRDEDGVVDCEDGCPDDPAKVEPGECGCGIADADSDEDGTLDCNDECPDDPAKIAPGECGCGASDEDLDGDGAVGCADACPMDADKIEPGDCGCGVSDVDTDGDDVADCFDGCDRDAAKTDPGICGCGVSDVDTDGDGVEDCLDACPREPTFSDEGNVCGGCEILSESPGDACGPCSLDTLRCDVSGDLRCDGSTTRNACGGCSELANEPGTACGSCGLDRYICSGTEATVCDGDTPANACGGCTPLGDDPGDRCGPCGRDRYECAGPNRVVCDGSTTECSPFARRCADGGTVAERCTSDGCAWDAIDSCDCGCSDGFCEDRVCSPGTSRCSGSTREECAPSGCEWSFEERCDCGCDGAFCADTNECGGCSSLRGSTGDSCGMCGELACSGSDALRCAGDRNPFDRSPELAGDPYWWADPPMRHGNRVVACIQSRYSQGETISFRIVDDDLFFDTECFRRNVDVRCSDWDSSLGRFVTCIEWTANCGCAFNPEFVVHAELRGEERSSAVNSCP